MGRQKNQTILSNATKYQATNSLSYRVHVTKLSFYISLSSRWIIENVISEIEVFWQDLENLTRSANFQ